jgi:hypothetical protein
MPEHKIVGRVKGSDIAPSNFQDGLKRLLDEKAEDIADWHKLDVFSRFGRDGMLVRLADDMAFLTVYLRSEDARQQEVAAEVLFTHAAILLAMEKGVWDLPPRLPLTEDDEPEEHLREH